MFTIAHWTETSSGPSSFHLSTCSAKSNELQPSSELKPETNHNTRAKNRNIVHWIGKESKEAIAGALSKKGLKFQKQRIRERGRTSKVQRLKLRVEGKVHKGFPTPNTLMVRGLWKTRKDIPVLSPEICG